MNIFSIAGIAIAAAAIAVLLKRYNNVYSLLIGLAAGLLIFFMILNQIQPIFDEINKLMNGTKTDPKYVSILFKCLGVCFVSQIASDACRDAGETAIASKVELAGKFTVLLIALPLFGEIADLALKLMSK